jgi:hypothetical protein
VRLIETEEAAKRLARVILSDIEIYNRQKVRAQADLKPQLEEGYALFRARVAPALVPLFSELVADRWPDAAAKPAAGARGPTPTRAAAVAPPRIPAAPLPLPVTHPPEPPPRPAAVAPRRDSLDPREAARRLARVMASSIQAVDRPGRAAEITEARALFRSCVLPELAPLFDEALSDLGLLEPDPVPVRPAPAPPPPPLVSPYESTREVPSATSDQTDQTTAPHTFFDEPSPPPPQVAAPPEPDEDVPTVPLPTAVPHRPPSLLDRNPPKVWLAVTAVAVAIATAGVVYLLLT